MNRSPGDNPVSRPIIGRFPQSFEALNHTIFRRYWLSQGFSLIGSWMQVTAQAWLVFDLIADTTDAAVKFGYISAVQFAPVLVLSLFAGVVIDARSRRTVLLASQGTLACSALVLTLFTLSGSLTYPLLLVLACLNGVASAFDVPARQSLIPDLVPKPVVRNAVALNSLLFNTARLIGPSIAALLIAVSSRVLGETGIVRYSLAFGLNALSYSVVLATLFTIPLPERATVPHKIFAEIREGLRFTFATPEIRIATLLVGSLSLTIVNFQTLVPLFARQVLQVDVSGLGLLLSSLGLGAIIAFWINSRFADEARLMLMRRGVLLLAFSFIAFTLTPNVWLAVLTLISCGLGMILTMVNAQATVQLMVPDALRGRVMSIYMLVFSGLVPFGAILATQLAGHLGARNGLFLLGLLGLTAALSLRPHRRDLRRAQERLLTGELGTD